MLPQPPPIRVEVRGHVLHTQAREIGGRVYVPMRAIFEALGATVVYDAKGKRVTATAGTRHLVLPLAPPVRVIDGSTFVPVRYVSEQLGEPVAYDGTDRVVFVGVAPAPPPRAVPSPLQVPLSGLRPAPDSTVGSAYPTIAAKLDLGASTIARMSITVDGTDVTAQATYDGSSVAYIPRDGLPVGFHTVTIDGNAGDGAPFDVSWSFHTAQPPAPDAPDAGVYYGAYRLQLSVFGAQAVPGTPVGVQLIAPPGGTAYAFVCNSAWQYQLYAPEGSPYYNGSVLAPWTRFPVACPVTALYISAAGYAYYAPSPQYLTVLPQLPGTAPAPPNRTAPQQAPSAPPPALRPPPAITPAPALTPKPVATRYPLPTARPVATVRPPAPRPRPRPTATPTSEPRKSPRPD
jgi:hypothetical protein